MKKFFVRYGAGLVFLGLLSLLVVALVASPPKPPLPPLDGTVVEVRATQSSCDASVVVENRTLRFFSYSNYSQRACSALRTGEKIIINRDNFGEDGTTRYFWRTGSVELKESF